MTINTLEDLRKIAIIAMFSDDELMERLVLKGGNAISIIHEITTRTSMDLDFSIENEFEEDELPHIESKIRNALEKTFLKNGYIVFDFNFAVRPQKKYEDHKYWGGYKIEFKLIDKNTHKQHADNIVKLRKHSLELGFRKSTIFSLEISKFEYCGLKVEKELNGCTIYVYTPEMIVVEKLRAICQQMPDYHIGNKSPRAKDFYDIFILMNKYSIDLSKRENMDLIKIIFDVKKVGLPLLGNIKDTKDYHEPDFISVKDTFYGDFVLRDFDYYFNYVVEQTETLKPLWEE